MLSLADIILFGLILGGIAATAGLLPAWFEHLGLFALTCGPILFVAFALCGARVLRLLLAMRDVLAATSYDPTMTIGSDPEIDLENLDQAV